MKFKVSGMQEGIRIYAINADERQNVLEIQDSLVCVQSEFIKNDTITLVVEMNGILTEPSSFALPRRNPLIDKTNTRGGNRVKNPSGKKNPTPKNEERERKNRFNGLK